MKQAWQLLGEYGLSGQTGGDGQAVRSICVRLEEIGVQTAVLERLSRHLIETAQSIQTRSSPALSSLFYQVFVPARRDRGGRGPQSWAFFLVTIPAGRPRRDDRGRYVIQVFLYPAAQYE